jgi:hypothetical protein
MTGAWHVASCHRQPDAGPAARVGSEEAHGRCASVALVSETAGCGCVAPAAVKAPPHVAYARGGACHAPAGWPRHTAGRARAHGARRPPGAAGGRRGSPRGHGREGVRPQRALTPGDAHVGWPQARVRRPWPHALPTQGPGAARRGQPWTPAMAAGWTDHGGSLRAVVGCRGPPWPHPQARSGAAAPDAHGTAQRRDADRPGRNARPGPMTPLGRTITGGLTLGERLSTGPSHCSVRCRYTTISIAGTSTGAYKRAMWSTRGTGRGRSISST